VSQISNFIIFNVRNKCLLRWKSNAKNSSCKYLSKAIIFSIFRFLPRVLNFSINLTSRKRWNVLNPPSSRTNENGIFLLVSYLWFAGDVTRHVEVWLRCRCKDFWVSRTWSTEYLYTVYSHSWVAIMKTKFQIRQRRYHQCSKPPSFKSANAATNLT